MPEHCLPRKTGIRAGVGRKTANDDFQYVEKESVDAKHFDSQVAYDLPKQRVHGVVGDFLPALRAQRNDVPSTPTSNSARPE
jgi:hypothetical protein